jgi:hypothetical protein
MIHKPKNSVTESEHTRKSQTESEKVKGHVSVLSKDPHLDGLDLA